MEDILSKSSIIAEYPKLLGVTMPDIKLIDLIKLSGVELKEHKIHCAKSKEDNVLDIFFAGKFKEWQADQSKKNFERPQILSMIAMDNDRWLFAGLWDVLGVREVSSGDQISFLYSTAEVPGLEHLVGRAIIYFEKKFRASYLNGSNFDDQLIVSEIRDRKMTVGDFPGYNSVNISYRRLKTIVGEAIPSWKTALSNVAGVYVITDNHNGKLYVGSAYGENGFWERWSNYTKTAHGGNKEFKSIKEKRGESHFNNFIFSILEVCDLNLTKEQVIERENHWKRVLLTKEFGYNIT